MFQLNRMDVAHAAYVAIVFKGVLSVFRWFKSIFHLCFPNACCNCVYLDVANVPHICCMCFIWMLLMVAIVWCFFKCFRSMFQVFR
jgi:hypothetical protein